MGKRSMKKNFSNSLSKLDGIKNCSKIRSKKDWDKIVSVLIYHVQKLLMQELLIFLRLFLRRTEAS